jgi:ribosome maturation factor RimP
LKTGHGHKKKRVVDVVRGIVEPFCKSNGMVLDDVEFVKEGPHRYLRVIVDKNEGVGIDDCQMVSRFLNSKLDEVDPIEENYFLEVTSPGVERELKKPSDFVRFAGKKVQANLFNPINGTKVVKGTLVSLEDNKVSIETENSGVVEVPKDKISLIRLVIDFANMGEDDGEEISGE